MGKESAVTTGDLSGQEPEFMPGRAEEPGRAGVRAAIVAQASCGKTEAGRGPGTADRSRVTTGGAKGGRKANPEEEGPGEANPPRVPPRADKQGGEELWLRHKAERGVWSRGMLEALDRGVKGGKWFSLIDKVYRLETLVLGWERVKSNAGACGVDGVSVRRFEKEAKERLLAVKEQLERGAYVPQPIRRAWIAKEGSKEQRPLGIPTVRDRVVQTALRMVIEPILEREFAPQSYGFRPGRGCKDALRRVEELLESGHLHVVDIDIRGYFDTIPHEGLLERVGERIADGRVLGLIEGMLKAGVMGEMEDWEREEGTPQGGVISPLLSNLYLNPLDWQMREEGLEMVRYADDMIVLCRDAVTASEAMERVQRWMERAGLQLHPEKTRTVDMNGAGSHFDFLGYRFWRSRQGRLTRVIRPKSRKKLRERIKKETKRTNGRCMEAIVGKINPILRGWYGYFKHARGWMLREMDGWVRERLRSLLRKRSKRAGRARASDHPRWPNRYFDTLGLFNLEVAQARERSSLRNGAKC